MTLELARFAVLALATFYLAVTATRLHGPFGLAERLRWTAGVHRRRWLDSRPGGIPLDFDGLEDDWVLTGLECPVCAAPWAALAVLGLEAVPVVGPPAALVLAMAGGAAALWYAADRL